MTEAGDEPLQIHRSSDPDLRGPDEWHHGGCGTLGRRAELVIYRLIEQIKGGRPASPDAPQCLVTCSFLGVLVVAACVKAEVVLPIG